MREFLAKLTFGIEQKNLHKSEWPIVSDLIDKNIIKQGSVFKINEGFIAGSVDVARSGTGFLCPITDKQQKDVKISYQDMDFLEQDDLVIARLAKERGRVVAKVVWLGQKAVPYKVVCIEKNIKKIKAIDIKTLEAINLDVSQKALAPLPDGAILKIDSTTKRPLEVLGTLDNPLIDELISLALYDKKEEFSKGALTEAKSYGNEVHKELYPNRLDLTKVPFATIDPIDAKDFDDAIYFDKENYKLWVAIADVSFYVTPYSSLDKDAYERGFSIYFPHKSIPMLPRELSENICSLKPNENRLAYTFEIDLDKSSLEAVSFKLHEAVIYSLRRYNYDEIDEFLAGRNARDETDKIVFDWLFAFNEVSEKIRKERLKKGLDFHNDEVRLTLDDKQSIVGARTEVQTRSHQLIEDAMLLANKCAATYFTKGIFRVHDKPTPQKTRALVENLESIGIEIKSLNNFHKLVEEAQTQARGSSLEPFVDKLIIRAQQQARYASTNIGHFGLGFEKYTHFTSPIRRYSDLILHRLLKQILANDEKGLSYTLKTIDAVCVQVSELEREAAKTEWDFLDRKFARWAEANIGGKAEALVVDVNEGAEYPTIVKVTKPFYGPRVFILKDIVPLFASVEIEIVRVDLLRARIYGKVTKRLDESAH